MKARWLLLIALLALSAPALAGEAYDVVSTIDGKVHTGKVLKELESGFLFKPVEGRTFVIKFEDVKDMQSTGEKKGATTEQGNINVEVSPSIVQQPTINVGNGRHLYEHKLKSPAGGFLLSLLMPGTGQLYYKSYQWGGGYLGLLLLNYTFWTITQGDDGAPVVFALGGIVHGALGLISSIHAIFGVNDYNDDLIDEFYEKNPQYRRSGSLEFKGLGYAPLVQRGESFHTLSASWAF